MVRKTLAAAVALFALAVAPTFVLAQETTQAYPTTTVTTTKSTTTQMESTGTAAQPFGITMAAAFVGFLPEAERDSYTKLANYTPTAELGGMNTFLNTLTPDQAGMVVHAIAAINAMGMGGSHPKEGMSDYNVKSLLMGQIPDSDKQAFESMMSGMNDQQISTLQQLARDAFNGGLNDIGGAMTTSTSTP